MGWFAGSSFGRGVRLRRLMATKSWTEVQDLLVHGTVNGDCEFFAARSSRVGDVFTLMELIVQFEQHPHRIPSSMYICQVSITLSSYNIVAIISVYRYHHHHFLINPSIHPSPSSPRFKQSDHSTPATPPLSSTPRSPKPLAPQSPRTAPSLRPLSPHATPPPASNDPSTRTLHRHRIRRGSFHQAILD